MPTVPIEGGDCWYEETGSGLPVVCLHGGWQDHHSWQRQVDRLADEYRMIAVDIRGHGRTGPTDSRHYSIELFADDLERLLAALEVDHPLLAGISVGGMVIQTYLDRHPDAARGAVVGGPVQSMPPIDLPGPLKQLFSPLPLLTGTLSTIGPTATFESLLNSIQLANGGPWLTLDDEVRSKALTALDAISAAEFRKVFRALYRYQPPTLSNVSTPVLVLYGDHEIPAVKRQGKRLARSVETGAWRELAGAGHLVNQDQPDAFNDACAAFFDTLSSTAARVASE